MAQKSEILRFLRHKYNAMGTVPFTRWSCNGPSLVFSSHVPLRRGRGLGASRTPPPTAYPRSLPAAAGTKDEGKGRRGRRPLRPIQGAFSAGLGRRTKVIY
jgi:hypothetical protein